MNRIILCALAALLLSVSCRAQSACLSDADRAALQARFDAIGSQLNSTTSDAVVSDFHTLSAQLTTDNRCHLAENDAAFLQIGATLRATTFRLEFQACERDWHHTPLWTKWRRYHGHDPCWRAVRIP